MLLICHVVECLPIDPATWVRFLAGTGKIFSLALRKYFTCSSPESNPGRWIYRQTLYHVAVKADFYRKAVEVYFRPSPVTFSPTKLNFVPEVPGHREPFLIRSLGWVICGGRHCQRAKIFYLSQPGIEPRSLGLQANTLPRRCKSRLLPQGSRNVFYT